ncbi:MAG: hypothetical protein IIB05_00565 [Bacteroidetes bacterium]|nr:hypothetical protein [Bacteroidota bacterium]
MKNTSEQKFSWLKKENPFRVPDNYFDKLPEKIQVNIHAREKAASKPVTRIVNYVKPHLALAAVILGFALIGYTGFRYFINRNSESQINYKTYIYESFKELAVLLPYFIFPGTPDGFFTGL